MIEFEKDTWEEFVCNFTGKLSIGYTIEDALKNFLKEYWTELNVISSEAGLKDDEEEESLDVYFERRMKPVWNHVYDLNREIGKLKADVALLKEADAARTMPYGPVKYPNDFYPDVTPIPGNVPRWKIAPHANGYVTNTDFMSTTGYFQIVEEPKYTKEQMEEWAGLRFDDPDERR